MARGDARLGELALMLQLLNQDTWIYIENDEHDKPIIYISGPIKELNMPPNYGFINRGSKRFPRWYIINMDLSDNEEVSYRCIEKPGTFFIGGNKDYHDTQKKSFFKKLLARFSH